MTDLLIRSVVASALGVLALLLARRASASMRHLVAVAALATTLAVTLLGALVPRVRLPLLPAAPPVALHRPAVIAVRPAGVPLTPFTVTVPLEAARPFPWAAIWGAAVWGGVGLLLGLRWLSALLLLARRLRHAAPVSWLNVAVRDLPVPVLESDLCRAPLTAWIGHPVIVLPLGWRDWPAGRLSLVLRHEMAHVRRGDGWGLLLARLATAVAWPNPLVWWLARESARLTEYATDDLVLSEGVAPWRYAETLFAIAQACPATALLPALGMTRKAEVAHRVQMILEPKTPRTLVSRRARLGATLAAVALALPVAVAALGSQAVATPKASQTTITLPKPTDRPVFRFRCKVVRLDARGGAPVQVFPRGTAMPVVDVREGHTSTLRLTVAGLDHAVEIRGMRGEFLQQSWGPGHPPVQDRLMVGERPSADGKGTRGHEIFYFATRSGWLRYPLYDAEDRKTNDLLLLDYTRLDGGPFGPAPAAKAPK